MKRSSPKPANIGLFAASSLSSAGQEMGNQDIERVYWGKRILTLWGWMYLSLWAFLTLTMSAENDYLGSALIACVLAFAGSFAITFLFSIPMVSLIRYRRGLIGPEERLLAVVFAMGLMAIFPICLYFRLGLSVTLALILLYYQALVMLSRHSSFNAKLQDKNHPTLFPANLDNS